jgi:broad specificity phosphatase PhoE
MTPTVFLIRHGKTEMNDPGNEKIRGYSDVPLSHDGKAGVEATAKFLKDGGFKITQVLSSPLARAMHTAQIVADEHARVYPHAGLLPWNLGEYTEKAVKDVAPKMDHLQAMPDIKAPKGESYRDFYNRWGDSLDRMFDYAKNHPDSILAGVVHSRNLLALPSLIDGKEIGDVPVKGGPHPGSVTQLTRGADGTWEMQVIWEGIE